MPGDLHLNRQKLHKSPDFPDQPENDAVYSLADDFSYPNIEPVQDPGKGTGTDGAFNAFFSQPRRSGKKGG